jgi:hypothetical protein
MERICAAGRTAFFGGRWTEPCENGGRHSIGHPGGDPVRLCDVHFEQVNAVGLVNEPNMSEADFQLREQERAGAKKRRWLSRNRH